MVAGSHVQFGYTELHGMGDELFRASVDDIPGVGKEADATATRLRVQMIPFRSENRHAKKIHAGRFPGPSPFV